MDIKELDAYQKETERTTGTSDVGARLASFGMGISGEAGEVTDYLKKVLFHGHELDIDKVKDELGDVLWYVSTIASTCGVALSDVASANIEKLKKRYPEGFDSDRSINREGW